MKLRKIALKGAGDTGFSNYTGEERVVKGFRVRRKLKVS